jgi:hypothetical protein
MMRLGWAKLGWQQGGQGLGVSRGCGQQVRGRVEERTMEQINS